MPRLRGKELSDLYPKPKTYDQLKVERERAQLARQPKFVAPKIALWSTSSVLIVFITYSLIALIMNNHLSSAGAVISGTSFSFLACLAGMAVLFYLYRLISELASKTSLGSVLYVALLLVLVTSGLLLQLLVRNQLNAVLAIPIVLLFNFAITYFCVGFLLKRH